MGKKVLIGKGKRNPRG